MKWSSCTPSPARNSNFFFSYHLGCRLPPHEMKWNVISVFGLVLGDKRWWRSGSVTLWTDNTLRNSEGCSCVRVCACVCVCVWTRPGRGGSNHLLGSFSSLILLLFIHLSLALSDIHPSCFPPHFSLWTSLLLFYPNLIYTVPLPPPRCSSLSVISFSLSNRIRVFVLIPLAKWNPSWLRVIECQMLPLSLTAQMDFWVSVTVTIDHHRSAYWWRFMRCVWEASFTFKHTHKRCLSSACYLTLSSHWMLNHTFLSVFTYKKICIVMSNDKCVISFTAGRLDKRKPVTSHEFGTICFTDQAFKTRNEL